MKSVQLNILKVVTLLVIGFISGCETERILFTGPYHVRFTESTDFAKESDNDIVQLEVHLVGPAMDQDITVHYKITGDARENVDYIILGTRGEVIIEAGEYFGYIQLQLINNSNNILRSQDIVFTLETVFPGTLGVGQGKSEIGKEFTYTILDDCILGGTYIGSRESTIIPGISITSQDCEIYTLSNWNVGVFNTDIEMDLRFVDNGDNTLTIPQQEEENIDESLATIIGTGVVDPITRQIIFTITLVDFDGQPQVTIMYQPD
ncbi:MAG TPA: hypothetical protein VFU05_03350 [Cyclobacteriaceae bacterium]|nr:hypothetical protein [Cyclobacteriaceae bacterium]